MWSAWRVVTLIGSGTYTGPGLVWLIMPWPFQRSIGSLTCTLGVLHHARSWMMPILYINRHHCVAMVTETYPICAGFLSCLISVLFLPALDNVGTGQICFEILYKSDCKLDYKKTFYSPPPPPPPPSSDIPDQSVHPCSHLFSRKRVFFFQCVARIRQIKKMGAFWGTSPRNSEKG